MQHEEAKAAKVDAICAIEFGVAAGAGLLELQRYAVEVSNRFELRIDVVGFDMGWGFRSCVPIIATTPIYGHAAITR